MAWSPDGTQLVTLAKNHILNNFNPRSSLSPVSEMKGPVGSRGARIVWLEDTVIAVSGFDRYCVAPPPPPPLDIWVKCSFENFVILESVAFRAILLNDRTLKSFCGG